ncbi:MAG: acyl carrier protein [Epsilonproteobacteria bacterium]|nr:MAG: acyl carrier protein [Campylobacterota bacterium]
MIRSKDFKQMMIKHLKLEDITENEIEDDMALFGDEGLGLDSVDSIELVLAIEKEYDIVVDATAQYDTIFKNVNSLVTYINDNKK